MTATSAPPVVEDQTLPDWSPVPTGGARSARVVVAYAAVGLAMALALWALGHRVPAIVLAAVLTLTTIVALCSRRFAAAAERATGAIQHAAGRVLALVMLTAVQVLVFFPAWIVLRLLRIDLLDPGGPRDEATLWRPTTPPRGRPLHRRQFTYEPIRTSARRGRGGRPRAAAGLVALLLLVDLGLGAVIHRLDHSGDPATAAKHQSLLFFPAIAAGRGEPWLRELAGDIDHVWYGKRYDPFLGWVMPDFHGPSLNVTDGVRRSYEPKVGAGRPLDVYFLGGSTMFGLFERDEHTIPSEVARLAEADGIRLRPVNLGRMAYNNWQETLLLSQMTSAGRVPALAVFYDGANELVGQFRLGPHKTPGQQEEQEYAKRIGLGTEGGPTPASSRGSDLRSLVRSWTDVSAVSWLIRRVRGVPTEARPPSQPLTSAWAGDQQQEARAAGADAATVYAQGVGLARHLAHGYGFPTVHVWQPFLYSKPLLAGERQANGALGTDPRAWRRAYAVARSRLPPGTVDLAGALNGVRAPVMFDFVHTNEAGAHVIAEALYRRLKPALLRIRAARRP